MLKLGRFSNFCTLQLHLLCDSSMRKLCTLLCALITVTCYGQTTYLPSGSEEKKLLDRLETLSGSFSELLFLSTQPVNRKDMVEYLFNEKSNFYDRNLSNTDNYNINRAMRLSIEWLEGAAYGTKLGGNAWGNVFYKHTDLLEINKGDFFLAINPVLSAEGAWQQHNSNSEALFRSTQGISLRAKAGRVAGLAFQVANNYEQVPAFYSHYIDRNQSLPGAVSYTKSGNAYQYLSLNGYLDFSLIKNHMNLTMGYDRHFIGDGMRSVFLSDFAAPMPFVRLNTKIWKLQYQNLYLVAEPQFPTDPGMRAGKYKYLSAHHLSMNITRWLNVGLFETVTFSRDGHFEFGYMNPIIFYRAVERGMGSPDKVAIGINAKVLTWNALQWYGQFLINEFRTKEFFSNKGYVNTKWGAQLGFKYFNAFKLDNLDLQAELNIVRPYTFQHYSEANYSHNNLPLAHPLGAGFREFIGDVRYQPVAKLLLHFRAAFYQNGVDTGGLNLGNDILKNYRNFPSPDGVHIINGLPAKCIMLNLRVSYELRPGLAFDIGGMYRNYQTDQQLFTQDKTLSIYGGIRLNAHWKDYALF